MSISNKTIDKILKILEGEYKNAESIYKGNNNNSSACYYMAKLAYLMENIDNLKE